MMAAVAADMKIGFELAIEQHLLAARAFVPEIFRHRLPGDDRPDLRQHEIGEPAHRGLVAARRWLVEPTSPFRPSFVIAGSDRQARSGPCAYTAPIMAAFAAGSIDKNRAARDNRAR